jgi:hypothetical protein
MKFGERWITLSREKVSRASLSRLHLLVTAPLEPSTTPLWECRSWTFLKYNQPSALLDMDCENLPSRMAASKAAFLVFNSDIFRGSPCPDRRMNAVAGGRDLCRVTRLSLRV